MNSLIKLSKQYLFSPNRQTWEQQVRLFHYFPVICAFQPLITTPAGKTTLKSSIFNMNGRFGWITQELIAPISFIFTLYYNSLTPLQSFLSLPYSHILLSLLYVIHYINRSLISSIRAPNISPMHIGIWFMAIGFNYFNGYSLAGWFLLQFGRVDDATNMGRMRIGLGVVVWSIGFAGNIWHENVLYEIRNRANREKEEKETRDGTENLTNGGDDVGNGKVVGEDQEGRLRVILKATGQVYEVPEGGLFKYCWHPHYFTEWIEWTGYLIAAGPNCTPAINFLVNEIACMMPRAFQGVEWYRQKFGARLPKRKAAIPFVI